MTAVIQSTENKKDNKAGIKSIEMLAERYLVCKGHLPKNHISQAH